MKLTKLFLITPLIFLSGCENKKVTTIILARHGETEGNVINLIQGNKLDYSLTEKGKLQAKSLGISLNNYHFDAFYCSKLDRTLSTGLIALEQIANHESLEPIRDSRLDDLDYGNATGMTIEDATIRFGGVDFPSDFGPIDDQTYKPNFTDENTFSWYKRFNECLFEIANKDQGKTILVVSHGVSYYWGQRKFGEKNVPGLNNGGYAELKFKRNSVKLVNWHLDA